MVFKCVLDNAPYHVIVFVLDPIFMYMYDCIYSSDSVEVVV